MDGRRFQVVRIPWLQEGTGTEVEELVQQLKTALITYTQNLCARFLNIGIGSRWLQVMDEREISPCNYRSQKLSFLTTA